LLKVALNTKNQSIFFVGVHVFLFSGDDDAGLLLGTWMYIVCQYFRSSQGFPFYIVGEIVIFSLQNNLKYIETKKEAVVHVRQLIRSVHNNIQITYFCSVN